MKDKIYCYDCGKEIKTKGDNLIGAKFLVYDDRGKGKINIVKCDECFQRNPALTSFRECEVYSRVVGYLRPVQQWNEGKKAEFHDRKVFKE
jgi:hypothetical protein